MGVLGTEFHEPGDVGVSGRTDIVVQVEQFLHTIFVEDGSDIRIVRDGSRERTELRLSWDGLLRLEDECRKARAEVTRRLNDARGPQYGDRAPR